MSLQPARVLDLLVCAIFFKRFRRIAECELWIVERGPCIGDLSRERRDPRWAKTPYHVGASELTPMRAYLLTIAGRLKACRNCDDDEHTKPAACTRKRFARVSKPSVSGRAAITKQRPAVHPSGFHALPSVPSSRSCSPRRG